MAKATKLHILKGFSELLADYDFDKITVTMIVHQCNISRQTFYYHFTDIKELINWGINQYTHEKVEAAKNAGTIQEATVIYLSEIIRNKLFLRKCIASSLGGYMITLMKNSIGEYCSAFYCRAVKSGYKKSDDSAFIREFITYGIAGFIISNIFDENTMDIEELAERMYNSIFVRFTNESFPAVVE